MKIWMKQVLEFKQQQSTQGVPTTQQQDVRRASSSLRLRFY
jgi:hypothetical protein